MSFFGKIIKTSINLAKDPLNKDKIKDQQVALRSGIGTGVAAGDTVMEKGDGSPQSDPTKSGSASDKMAQLTRAQWDDYVQRFQPYDKALIGLATSENDNNLAIANASQGVANSFGVAQGTLQRNNERLGLSVAPDVTGLGLRDAQAQRTASQVNVMNNTRLAAKDRDNAIMSGSSGVRNSVIPLQQGA